MVWFGVPSASRTERRMAFDGPVAVFEGAALTFLSEQCEAFRDGLSASIDEYGYRVIDGPVLEEFGWLIGLLRHTVMGYPEEWPVAGDLVARRENILRQLEVLKGVIERARAEGRPVECWGE